MEQILKLRKRDGRIVDFEPERIVLAAAKANTDRGDCSEQVRAAGYDIGDSAERLRRIYLGARK